MNTVETSNESLQKIDIPADIDLSTATKVVEAVTQQRAVDQENVNTPWKEKLDKNLWDLKWRIRRTAENIDWSWKRWNIEFDWETNTIKSWWWWVKVEFINGDNIRLEWLDLSIPLDQLVRLANFKNWLKYTFWTQKVKYTRWLKSRLRTFFVENTKILHRYALERFCPICENEANGKKVEEWLNK